jgi:hypothetical protein
MNNMHHSIVPVNGFSKATTAIDGTEEMEPLRMLGDEQRIGVFEACWAHLFLALSL